MDFTANLLSVERRIRRRLKWKLLFQEIQNATYNSQDERIALVENLELLILEIKDKSKEIKLSKKGISVSIGSKIKKLHGKIKHRQNTRQIHSKSFIPEVLLKNNEFDTDSISDHRIKYVRSKVGAKDDMLKNVKKYLPVSMKENINYCDMSCLNIKSNSYAELPEILLSIDKHENIKKNNEVIKDQTVKQKKEKKSLLQIIDNLHLSNSMNKKCLSTSDNIEDAEKREHEKQDNNKDVVSTINNSNTKIPNKICSTKTLKKKQQKNELAISQNFQHNINLTREVNLDGERSHIVPGLSSTCKQSMSIRCDAVKEPDTILLKDQYSTIKSDSNSNKLYTVNHKMDDRKESQNVDDAFKVPAIPTKKIPTKTDLQSDNGVILNRSYNLLQIAKSATVDNDQEKTDSATANSINKTRMLIESLLKNLTFNKTNLKFGLINIQPEICLSQSDQRYVYKYAQYINAISRYDDLLSIVNYVEQQSPELTKYILGITVLDAVGRTNDSKYKYLAAGIKKKITAISKDVQKNNFEIYKEYVLWLFEAKRKRL